MTKDKQIIINGVDVSKCNYFNNTDKSYCEECCSEFGCAICNDRPNCYYKQLKRKEQECNKLYIQLKADEEYHKEEKKTLRKIIKNKEERNIALYKENNKLKQTLSSIKNIAEEQVPYLNISEAKTRIEIEYDYAGKICNLEQRMYKILQKISEVEDDR